MSENSEGAGRLLLLLTMIVMNMRVNAVWRMSEVMGMDIATFKVEAKLKGLGVLKSGGLDNLHPRHPKKKKNWQMQL